MFQMLLLLLFVCSHSRTTERTHQPRTFELFEEYIYFEIFF